MKSSPLPIHLYEPDALLAQAIASSLSQKISCELKQLTGPPTSFGPGLWILQESAGLNIPGNVNALLLSEGGKGGGIHPVLTKPFRLGELVDLVQRLSRRLPKLELGQAVLHPQTRQFHRADGTQVQLTEKEVDILLYLAEAGTPVARDTLLGEVFGYQQGVSTHTLETHIYRLRQKIERDPENPQLVKISPLAQDINASGYYLDVK